MLAQFPKREREVRKKKKNRLQSKIIMKKNPQKKKKKQFTLFGDYRGWPAALHLLVSGLRRLVRAKDGSDGDGTANTALVWHAKKLLALHEGGK